MFLKIVFGTMVLIGVLMSGFGIYFIGQGYEAEGWTKVEGRVVSSTIQVDIDIHSRSAKSEEQRRYCPSITYEWQVDGKTYTGSRYRLGETHEKYKERAEAGAAAARFRTGEPITVYYDKDHPSQAVLDPSLSVGVFVPLPLGLLFLALGGSYFLFREAFDKATQQGTQPGARQADPQ